MLRLGFLEGFDTKMMPTGVMMTCLLAQFAPVKLASPGLAGVNLSKEVATFYADHLAQQLVGQGLRVITATEISSLLGLERQKELLGCAETSASCSAELANALGVDGMVSGSIGRFDGAVQINVKIIAAVDGRTLSFFSRQVSRERDVLEALNDAAEKMAPEVMEAVRNKDNPPSVIVRGAGPSAVHPLRKWSWAPAAGGLIGIGVGTAFLTQVSSTVRALKILPGLEGALEPDEAARRYEVAKTQQTLGWVSMGLGVTALAGGVVMFFLGGESTPATASAIVVPGGGALVFSGPLP